MSSREQPKLLEGLCEAVASLDTAIVRALVGPPIFSGHFVYREIPEYGELRFMFIVSSLYKLYREAGGDNLKFLNAKIASSQGEAVRHYDLIHDLRTFDQHEVQSDSQETARRRDRCRFWFDQSVGLQTTDRPVGEAAWNKCIEDLLSGAVAYLCALRSFVDGLREGMGDYVRREWLLVRTRSIPHGEFDRMVSEIAGDIGMGSRDVVAFRNQHYSRIVSDLRAQRWDINVSTFVRQAITARLLEEFPGVILVAEDLKAVGMKPGRGLGRALKEAQRIWVDSGCRLAKDQVVARLRELGLIS